MCEPLLTKRERLRRVVILCVDFTRNLAYYRGAQKHPVGWKEAPLRPDASFWRVMHNNCIDACVLDWCKLFGDKKGQHYWGQIVSNTTKFESELLVYTNIDGCAFENFHLEMRKYRDKFVAHLDSERELFIPKHDLAGASVEFYHGYVIANEAQTGDLFQLPDSTEKLRLGYEQCEDEAARVYRELK